MGETDTLRFLAERFASAGDGVVLGIGDDSAVLGLGTGARLVASTDVLVEDVHFRARYMTPRQIGKKAVCVSLSDIGAMGAAPRFVLCSVGYPRSSPADFAEELAEGVGDGCSEFGVSLVGGNISESRTVFVNVTALGEIFEGETVTRAGAASGDDIYATGTLGDSALGLLVVSSGEKPPPGSGRSVARHVEPTPRLSVGRLLGRNGVASSMIDVSDGLCADLGRITADRGLGADVRLGDIPLSPGFLELSSRFCEDGVGLAVGGGEDYELLFTAPGEKAGEVEEVSRLCGVRVSKIGSVTGSGEVRFLDVAGNRVIYDNEGFRHFG